MERICVQTRWPFARPAAGRGRAGQVPSAVKGNVSANVGARYGVDLVSSPKRHQVAPKGRERRCTSLLSRMERRDKFGNYKARHTYVSSGCSDWGPRSLNPGPNALVPAAHCIHRLGAWIPWLLVGCVVYVSEYLCAPHYRFCSLFCAARSTWLLNSHPQLQPGNCDAEWNLWGVGKACANTLVLQGQGDGLSLDPLIGQIP